MALGATKQSSRFGLRALWQPLTAAPVFGVVSPAGAQVDDTPVKTRQHPGYSDDPRRPCLLAEPRLVRTRRIQSARIARHRDAEPRLPRRARAYWPQYCIDLITGWSALITWRPTRLLDVDFKAEQLVTQTSDTSATGMIANSFQLGVDHELRNVVISVAGALEKDAFRGQPRTDRVNTVASHIRYLPNRFGSISLFHRYIDRNSNISTFRYEKHLVGINATAQV